MEVTKKKHKKAGKVLLTILLILAALFVAAGIGVKKSPRLQLLISTVYFSEKTLKDPAYIAYNLDLMDLFQNYMNADVTFSGDAHMHSVQGLGFSSSMEVEGARSFSQKKMSFHADMDVLWFNVGELDLYAAEDTVYMIVPMLDNMSEAFDTGNDLFLKAPELSSDINRQWFHDNAGNIIELMQQIQVEETGETITDEDGTVSREYRVTIPQGTGGFLWELLGMDAPEYEITVSIYLTPRYHMRRIEMDLSDLVEDTTLVVDGEDVGTVILTRRLPDNEQAVMTAVRNSDITYTNVITMNLAYYTNTSDVYEADMYLTIDPQEDYTGLKISDITVTKGDATLAEGSFEGTVSKTQDLPDIFADITMDLNTIETIRWEEIRNDTEGFINDMIERAKENM